MINVVARYVAIAGITIASTILVRDFVPPTMREIPGSAWEVFYGGFGIIYAILIGFLLAELLTRYHKLFSVIEAELNSLRCIRDYLVYVNKNEGAKASINNSLGRVDKIY